MRQLTEEDCVFDGFMHRPFNPKIDGWRNEMPDPNDYPSLQIAKDMMAMFKELQAAKLRIWELERELESFRGRGWVE